MITVYVDVLFLINFSIDYLVIVLTGAFFHYHIKKWKELLAAFLLSFYAMWALLICGSYLLLLITAISILLVTCRLIYPIRGARRYLGCVTVFTALSILIGGIVELLFRLMANVVKHLTGERDGRQVIVFACLALLSGVLIYMGNRLLDVKRGEEHVEVDLELLGRTYHAMLLVDTGNLAIEPLSGRRVIFLSNRYAEKTGMNIYINNNEEFLKRKRIVIIDTVNGRRAVSAYLCDKVILQDRCVCSVIAMIDECLAADYDGIFPSALL